MDMGSPRKNDASCLPPIFSMLATGAQAQERLSMEVAQSTAAPAGFLDFCRREPGSAPR